MQKLFIKRKKYYYINNYNTKIFFFSLIFLLFFMSKIIATENNLTKTLIKKHILVFDNLISNDIPKRYREGSNMIPKLYSSASAQPNLRDFEYIIKYAKKKLHTNNSNKIFVIDLRQEPHAILDGKAISWYGLRNQIPHYYEKHLINKLKKATNIKIYNGINKLPEGNFIPKGFVFTTNKNLLTEEELITKLGANYFRLLVTDHFAPDDHQINLFVDFLKKIPKNSWVHFHCRGGRGRSTTFMVMLDIIQNAQLLTLDEILERQKKLGGVNLSKTSFTVMRKKWKEDPAKQRYEFIKKFYIYVKDPNGYKITNWQDWIIKNANNIQL